MNGNLITEAKQYLVHDIAPQLSPSLRGLFQARVVGLYRNHAQIEVRLVNERREVLKSFGSRVVPAGGAVIVDQFSSVVNIAPGAPAVKAFFQAWCVGINQDNTEAEISLRLVDENRKELLNFGSMTKRQGGTVTLQGMEIVVNIVKGH